MACISLSHVLVVLLTVVSEGKLLDSKFQKLNDYFEMQNFPLMIQPKSSER